MKSDPNHSHNFLSKVAHKMRDDAAKEFLAVAVAGDDVAFEAACQKGEAARKTLRQQQGHALHADVALAIGIKSKIDS